MCCLDRIFFGEASQRLSNDVCKNIASDSFNEFQVLPDGWRSFFPHFWQQQLIVTDCDRCYIYFVILPFDAMSLSLRDYIAKYRLDQATLRTLVRHGHLSTSEFPMHCWPLLPISELRQTEAPNGQSDDPNGARDNDSLSSLRMSELVARAPDDPNPEPSPSTDPVEVVDDRQLPAVASQRMRAIRGKDRFHSRHCHHLKRPEVRNMTSQGLCSCAVRQQMRADNVMIAKCYSPLYRDGNDTWHSVMECARLRACGHPTVGWTRVEACAQCSGFPM